MKKTTLIILCFIALILSACQETKESQKKNQESISIPYADPTTNPVIGTTYAESTPDFPAQLKAKEGSPNIFLILLDDVGFGMCSTTGGPVPTPHLDQLANEGLVYNRFHTTAICSPTRASLLTGRNHHSAGSGVIPEMGTGYPGYTGIIPQSTVLISEVLRENGYATSIYGKWHNTPEPDISPAGPFNRWPNALGFDYFYGFNQGETDQFYPVIYKNTTRIEAPSTPEEGYHFTSDMTNELIDWVNHINAVDEDKPWFAYYSTGAIHAPLQVPFEWIEKFKGKFSHGWDKQREMTYNRQLEMGMIPEGTQLTPRPAELPAWDDSSEKEKAVYERLMEVYAAFMAHTDYEIGRVVNHLEEMGELDNTLIMYIVGDNGPSPEGGLTGTFNEIASLMGIPDDVDSMYELLDEMGGPDSEPHVPVGWAWAMSSPLQWTKQVASHYGGTRNPLIVHWPAGIEAKGEIRDQWHHVIDVVPTILEVCDIDAPDYVKGIEQKPIDGVSMAYSFDQPKTESTRKTQYFEIMGNRAIYHEGWVACSRYGVPWILAQKNAEGLANAEWELYHVAEDFSQAKNLATEYPEKLEELKALFMEEAEKYDVFPLDPRLTERYNPTNRMAGEPATEWTYHNKGISLPEPLGPQIFPRHHIMEADVVIPEGGAEGVIACAGSHHAGWTYYIMDNKFNFHYSIFDRGDITIETDKILPTGKVKVSSEFIPEGNYEGTGTMKLLVNGELVGEGKLVRSIFRHSVEPFDIGHNSGTIVGPAYKDKGQFEFSGEISKLFFKVLQ